MAGTLIVSNLTTDTDNTFIVRSNTGTTLFSANTTGIDVANSIGATAITNDKILSVANTKISGNIISSQITSVANTQLTGLIEAAQIGSANATLVTSGTLPKARLPTGSVLQVVSKQITTETSTSSASFVDLTDFSQAITPSSASSKILVFFSVQSVVNNLNNNSPVRLLRDSTGLQDYDYWNYNGAGAIMVVGSYSYLDSPNTTSSVTYKLQGRSLNGGIGQVVNFIYDDVNGDAKGSITLMEIAA